MCLSTVYERRKDEKDACLLRNVAKVQIDPEQIVFTDLMGARSRARAAESCCTVENSAGWNAHWPWSSRLNRPKIGFSSLFGQSRLCRN